MYKENSKLFYYLLFCLGMVLAGSSVVVGKELTLKIGKSKWKQSM